jgi:modification methylase
VEFSTDTVLFRPLADKAAKCIVQAKVFKLRGPELPGEKSDIMVDLQGGFLQGINDIDKAHPTQKPEALLHRLLVATTNPGDVVLDPFFGTGTTGAVAKMLGRDWIGIEREPAYRAAAAERLSRVRKYDREALMVSASKRAEPRVPFGQVVERGLLRPGETLTSPRGIAAKVRADGTLISGEARGSIHQVGAALEGAPSCNGWTYWSFRRDGQTVPIDILRQQIRSEME